MSVYRVLDKLESYVHEGTWLPAGYRVLSEERLLEFIEKIRATLPEEVGRAQMIAKGGERVLRAAQEKAQAIVEQASSVKDELLDQHEIVQRARTTADVVLREAEERARKVREGADTYAAQILAEMEGRLAAALGSVQKGRAALAGAAPKPAASGPLADAAAKSKRAAFDLQAPHAETSALESVETVKA
jgi:cell division septum initiation protein DivIVA